MNDRMCVNEIVKGGLVDQHNKNDSVKADERIMLQDKIYSVNGVIGDYSAMYDELRKCTIKLGVTKGIVLSSF